MYSAQRAQTKEGEKQVQEELEAQNQGLLIWDAYRPTRAIDYFLEWEQQPENLQIKGGVSVGGKSVLV